MHKKDDFAEIPLRPQALSEFVGQGTIVKRLEVSILSDVDECISGNQVDLLKKTLVLQSPIGFYLLKFFFVGGFL